MPGLSDKDLQDLLTRLIRFETPDPPGREIEIATFIRDFLENQGIPATLDEFAPGRANVLARVEGSGTRPGLIFSAHMDTLPPGNQTWRHGPYSGSIDGSRLYGRGAADMKSGLAAMISAAIAVARSDGRPAGDLILAFTGGESSNCLGAKVFIEQNALADAGALLVSEPSSMKPLTAEKGALWLELTTHGRAGHTSGSGADETAPANAITGMMRVLDRLGELETLVGRHPLLGHATANVGMIDGGSAVNLTPDICHASIDIRFLPGQNPSAIEAEVTGLASGLEVRRLDLKPAVETDQADPFVDICCSVNKAVTGEDAAPGGVGYFSDSSVLVPALGVPRVIIGPGTLGMSGALDEYVELDALHQSARVYHAIAKSYLQA